MYCNWIYVYSIIHNNLFLEKIFLCFVLGKFQIKICILDSEIEPQNFEFVFVYNLNTTLYWIYTYFINILKNIWK